MIFKQFKVHLFLVLVFLNFTACGTWHERYRGAYERKYVYCATYMDVGITTRTLHLHEDRYYPVFALLCPISLPIDFAIDTVLLPYDFWFLSQTKDKENNSNNDLKDGS